MSYILLGNDRICPFFSKKDQKIFMIAKLIFWSFATPFDITIFWSQMMINLYLWHRCFLSHWTNLDTLHPLWHWLAAGQELSVADGVGPISLCTLWSILFGPGQPSSLCLCRLTKFIRKVKEHTVPQAELPRLEPRTDQGTQLVHQCTGRKFTLY